MTTPPPPPSPPAPTGPITPGSRASATASTRPPADQTAATPPGTAEDTAAAGGGAEGGGGNGGGPSRGGSAGGCLGRVVALLFLVFLGAVVALGYRVARDHVAADVYLERYEALNDEHNDLIEQYNKAVTRTAVTELVVAEGQVQVHVRTADGNVEVHDVAADPANAIYVDYVVKNGRLLIRRVFDSRSVPDDAGVIDSQLLDIDWSDPGVRHGKAIYRQLTDGRWIVTVSGDGSLALVEVDPGVEVELLSSPEVGEYDPVEETRRAIQKIRPADVVRRLFGAE